MAREWNDGKWRTNTHKGGERQQKSLIFLSRSVTLNNRSFFHTTLSYAAFRDLPEHKATQCDPKAAAIFKL